MATYEITAGTSQETAQGHFNNAAPGDVITVQNGETFLYQLSLPPKAYGPPIRVRTDTFQANSNWPSPQQRVTPDDAVGMGTLATKTGGSYGDTITYGPTGYASYAFEGLHVTQGTGRTDGNATLMTLGPPEPAAATKREQLPQFEFNQCVIDGNDTAGWGLWDNGGRLWIRNSYLRRFTVASQAPCLQFVHTVSPKRLWNTTFEVISMGTMAGGLVSNIAHTPRFEYDVEFRHCHFKGDLGALARAGVSRDAFKQAIEFKFFSRLLVEGCVFEDIWESSFGGVFNSNHAAGGGQSDPQGISSNSVWRYNYFKKSARPFAWGVSVGIPTTAYDNHLIEHNLFELYNPNLDSYALTYSPFVGGMFTNHVFRKNTIYAYGTTNSNVPTLTCPAVFRLEYNPTHTAAAGGGYAGGYTIDDNLVLLKKSSNAQGMFLGNYEGVRTADGVSLSVYDHPGEAGGINAATNNNYNVRNNVIPRASHASFAAETFGTNPIIIPYADIATVLADHMDFEAGICPRIKTIEGGTGTWKTAAQDGGRVGCDADLVEQYTAGVREGLPSMLPARLVR